jgi:hypothetical protein
MAQKYALCTTLVLISFILAFFLTFLLSKWQSCQNDRKEDPMSSGIFEPKAMHFVRGFGDPQRPHFAVCYLCSRIDKWYRCDEATAFAEASKAGWIAAEKPGFALCPDCAAKAQKPQGEQQESAPCPVQGQERGN